MDDQLRLTDLVPKRLSTFVLMLLAGLSCVAGLEILYSWMPEVAGLTSDGRVAAFDLDGEGSLAVWFSSVLLLMAGAAAVLIYTVRRHKTDDYHGRYRIWLAAAACWVLMSLDESASLHEGFKEMMGHVTGTTLSGTRLLGDGSLWWAVPYAFLLAVVGSRLVVDMRDCRLASGALLSGAACYVVAVVVQMGWIMPESGSRGVMLEEGAEMVGNLLVLLSMGLYARYVILDAEGLLPDRGRETDEEEEITADQWIKIEQAHGTPQPVLKRKARPRSVEPEEEMEFEAEESVVQRRLTKQEKKALRKRLMRERMERERTRHKAWK